MNKNTLEVLFFFLALIFTVSLSFAQSLYAKNTNEYDYYSHKNNILSTLKKSDTFPTTGKQKNLKLIGDIIDSTSVFLADSLEGMFEVLSIKKKKNNFLLKNGKIHQTTIFWVDIQSINNNDCTYPKHICLLIPKIQFESSRIFIGDILFMKIFPLFSSDRFLHKNNGTVVSSYPSLNTVCTFIYNNVMIRNFHPGFRNYYEMHCCRTCTDSLTRYNPICD